MPRPFPFPINIGTDICSIQRIFRILTSQRGKFGESFFRKILTERERQEIPNKIVKPLGLWKDIERKRAALEAKRREFGLVSDQIWGREAPLAPQVPRKRTGDRRIVSDGPVLDKVEELVGRVNNLDIMNNIIKDTEQEEKVVRGALKKTAEFLAGRFAAKEAAIKAYHSRRLTYHDIWIQKQEPRDGMSQAPIAVVISEKGDWNDGQVVPINISHDSDYATAVCMAYESSPGAVFETAADISTALSSIGEGPKEDTHNIGLLGRLPATKRIIPVSRSIWVSNLSSETTHLDLEKLFEGYSRIIRAYISHGDQGQSYCYGFVVLDSRRDAFQARKWRHGSFLNGRRIACQLVTGSYEYVLKEGEEGVILGSHIASVAAARQGISWKGTSRFHSVSDFQNRHLTSEEIKGKVSNNALSLPQEIPSPSGGHGKYLEWLAEQGEKGEAEHYFRRNKSLRIDNIPLEVNRIDLEKIFAGFSRRPTKGYIARNPEGNSLGYGYVVLDRTRQSQRCRLVTRTFSLWGKEISCRAIRQDEIVNLEGRVERPRPRTTKALAMVTDIKAPKTTCWKTLSWKYKAKTDHQPTTVLEEDAEELENGIGKHPPAADAKDGEDEGNRFTTG